MFVRIYQHFLSVLYKAYQKIKSWPERELHHSLNSTKSCLYFKNLNSQDLDQNSLVTPIMFKVQTT